MAKNSILSVSHLALHCNFVLNVTHSKLGVPRYRLLRDPKYHLSIFNCKDNKARSILGIVNSCQKVRNHCEVLQNLKIKGNVHPASTTQMFWGEGGTPNVPQSQGEPVHLPPKKRWPYKYNLRPCFTPWSLANQTEKREFLREIQHHLELHSLDHPSVHHKSHWKSVNFNDAHTHIYSFTKSNRLKIKAPLKLLSLIHLWK